VIAMTDHTDIPGQGPASPQSTAPAAPKGVPQYRLTQKAYLNDKLLEEGAVIYWTAPPEHYMVPLNDAARAEFKKYNPQYIDPMLKLPVAPVASATPE
jgi:hypothetical protein